MKDFELDDVYVPEVAIRLAVRYVADLLKLFPKNPYAVLAAYNAGEQNVERWIFRARSNDVDRLMTEIAIPETKDYVAKVMNSYWAYHLSTQMTLPRGFIEELLAEQICSSLRTTSAQSSSTRRGAGNDRRSPTGQPVIHSWPLTFSA